MFPARQSACLLLVILLAACAPARQPDPCPPGGFSIYLSADPLNGAEILRADLAKIRLESQPIVASEEIFSYTLETRALRLAPAALQRLSELKVPMNGRAFVACAGGQPLLRGAFWSYLSSLSYNGVSIMVPVLPDAQSVRMDSGYPGSQFAAKDDPLQDPAVLGVLRGEEKLK